MKHRTLEEIDNDLTPLLHKRQWTVRDRDKYDKLAKEKRESEYHAGGQRTEGKEKVKRGRKKT